MRLRGIISVSFALLCCSTVLGQNDFRKEFDEYSKSNMAEFKNFEEKNNAEFAETLKNNWEKFQATQGKIRLNKPKPRIMPKYENTAEVSDEEINVSNAEKTLSSKDTEAAVAPVRIGSAKNPHNRLKTICFDFYGVGQRVDVPEEYGTFHLKGISEHNVSTFWKHLADYPFASILESFYESERDLHLNDWAASEWVASLSQVLYPDNIHTEQEVFSVFFLNQLGLSAKIARVENRLVRLFASVQQIYARPFIDIGDTLWYPFHGDFGDSDVFTYRQSFVLPTRPFDMRLNTPIDIGTESDMRYVAKQSKTFGCEMKVPINAELMKFYAGYPQMDVQIYADAEPSTVFNEAILEALSERVREKGERDAVNAILAFLQKDFKYATDDEQFGYEKPFFCEENFIFDCNDCEDRAILMSRLVRSILGLKVVLLEYQDHIAVAVRFKEEMHGDYFIHDGSNYYICDPTYIGAPAGECMPIYKSQTAKIIELQQF